MKPNPSQLNIDIVEGDRAPRYDEGTELACVGATITEQATEGNLPIVDFRMRGPDGQLYVLVLTGRIINALSGAIKGINLRNHGKEEP
jgi:hypothetical protein